MKRLLSFVLAMAMLLSMVPAAFAVESESGTLSEIDEDTLWAYLDDNTDPAGDASDRLVWTAEDYDDSNWKTGAGAFGSQKGSLTVNGLTAVTLLEGCAGSNDTPAYFFRSKIQIDTLEGFTQLKGSVQYDDAVIIYINGVKVAEGNNVAADSSTGDSLGTAITENLQYGGENKNNPNEDELSITDLSMLHTGVNTVAVEIHQNRSGSSDVWFDLDLELSTEEVVEPAAQTDISLSMGADETQMNFTWYTPDAEAGTILIAKNSQILDGQMPADAAEFKAAATLANDGNYSNQATVTGLEAGTTYVYQLVNGEAKSDIYTFTTDDGGAFSFAYVGDPQIGASGNAVSDAEGWDKTVGIVAENAIFSDISFLLSAGDQVNVANNEDQYDGYLNHEGLLGLPVATVIGNHDSSSDAYGEHFNLANESSDYGTTAAGGDSYFVYNNVLFMVLNSNDQSAAEHKTFMEAAIQANPDVSWKVVTFHHSIYTVASHAYDNDILLRREALVPIFEELDIDVVLMGHDHVYCRSYIMDGLTPVTDAAEYDDETYSSITNPDGILYVTANSGSGSKTYNILNSVFEYAAVQNQEHIPNVAKISVSDSQFTITTYRTSDMSVVDTFTINRTTEEEEDDAKYLKGDVNLDGCVDSADVNLLFKYVMEETELSQLQLKIADVNEDAAVDSADVNLLFKYVMEEIDSL